MNLGKKDMGGRLCMVTGANSGIGFETSRMLYLMGADVVMVCRDEEKATAARDRILKKEGSGSLEVMICDLSSQLSIHYLVEKFKKSHTRLDVLINNAGIIAPPKRALSVDGIELTFAVNHLAYFLLTNLLVDTLKETGSSRVVNVASKAQRRLDFKDIQNLRDYNPHKAYARSKLANVMFTYSLAEKLKGDGVTVNCLHPGVVNTKLFDSSRWAKFPTKPFFDVAKHFFKTPRQGASTSVYLASSDDVKDVTGKYFIDGKESKSHIMSYDADARRRLWKISEELTSLTA